MSKYSSIVVDGDTVGNLTKEDDQLSPPFGEEFVSLQLGWILGKFGIRVGQGLDVVSVNFFSLPLVVVTVRKKVAKCFIAVQPHMKLSLPDLKLLFCESSHRELFWWVYLSDWHSEAWLYTLLYVLYCTPRSMYCTIVMYTSMYCTLLLVLCTVLY